MKREVPSLLMLLCIMILGLHVSAHAEIGITQVTTNAYEDSSPHIRGDYLVWQGEVDGDWEIFLYNVATGEGPVRITHNAFDDISPQTDGNYLVWLGFSQPDGPDGELFLPGGEVFLYDMSNGQTTRVTNDTNLDSPPQIANGKVVWSSHVVGDSVEPSEIFLYDIVTGLTEQLTSNTFDDSSPRINDSSVVWIQADEAGTTTWFIHYLGNGTEPTPRGFVWKDSPQKDGDLMVLARYDGSDREILVHSKALGTYEQITDNGFEDRYPLISGRNVAWIGGKGKDSEIFWAFYDDGQNAQTICSTLRRFPYPTRDLDMFIFSGEAGEEIAVRLEPDPEGYEEREYATLIVKVAGHTGPKWLWYWGTQGRILIDNSALPKEVNLTLPRTADYEIWVLEYSGWLTRFFGDYCLTLESSQGAWQTFEPTHWVE